MGLNVFERFVVKALNKSQLASQLTKAIFRMYGAEMPVWMKYNVEQYITEGYEKNADVYAVVNKIVGLATMVPWETVDVTDPDNEEVIKDHEINEVWRTLDVKTFLSFRLVTGNGLAWAEKIENGPNRGKIMDLSVMPSDDVEVMYGSWKSPVQYYYLRNAPDIHFDPENVIHTKGVNLDFENGGWCWGMSPITAAARAVTTSNAGYEAKARDFQSGGMKGFISGEGNDVTLSQQQADALKRTLRKVSQDNDFHITNSRLKWNAMGLSPVDMAILDSINADRSTICNVFGISEILFSATESKYANYDLALKSAYTEVVMPLLKEIQECVKKMIIPFYEQGGRQYEFRPDYSDIEVLQDNMVEKTQWLNSAWWLTINERREQMNYPPMKDPQADEIHMPANLIALSTFTEEIPMTDEELAQLQLREYGKLE